jgi:NADH-quinone oxidoreductase subunit N
MASAADMIILFLAVETASIPLYILAGFFKNETRSIEAGIKYMLFGAMSSAIMLYGFSLLYGFSGTTQIYHLAEQFHDKGVTTAPLLAGFVLVLAGFGFKISAVPFHFWAPDVYEGSPTPVAGFLSTASKAAGFAVVMRFVITAFPELMSTWVVALGVIAVASMFVGNILAISQKNIKRLLAYSSIAQAGYILIGVAANSALGISGTVYYLMAYLVTNLAVFGIVHITSQTLGSDDLAAFRGLSRRSPALALAMLAAILSLGGIPPFAGFIGKFLVFTAAVEKGMLWLVFLGILNTIFGLYYYLNVLKVVYLYRSEGDEHALKIPWNWSLALSVCMLGVVLLGTFAAPWYQWASQAAGALLGY